IRAVTQAQGVAQFVHHNRLEVVLGAANCRGVGTGIPVPALDDGDVAVFAAKHPLGDAANGAGGGQVQDVRRQCAVARTDLQDVHAEGVDDAVDPADRVFDARQLLVADVARRIVHVDHQVAGEQLTGRVRRVVPTETVSGQGTGRVPGQLQLIHHE